MSIDLLAWWVFSESLSFQTVFGATRHGSQHVRPLSLRYFERLCYGTVLRDHAPYSQTNPKASTLSSRSSQCHATSASVPTYLDPGQKGSLPRFATQLIRRCSNPECPTRRGPSRGSLVLSAKKFKQIIAISLKSRSFHSIVHLDYGAVTTEETEVVILTTATDIKRLAKLLESGQITVRERNPDNWTLLHVSGERLSCIQANHSSACCILWDC